MHLDQRWKKLHALHAMRADILPRITHFWGHFAPKIPHFCRNFGAGIEDRQFKIEGEDWGWGLRKYWGWWLGLGLRIEDQGLRIEEVLRMRIEDGPKITHFCRDFLCGKSRTFEDISEPWKCPRADILSFFPVLVSLHFSVSLFRRVTFWLCILICEV